jgi:outer membrane immunogenic protein
VSVAVEVHHLLSTLLTGAQAADIEARPYTKAPVAPVASWTGFYAGANVGYGWEDTTATFTPNDLVSAIIINGFAPASVAPINPPTSFGVNGAAGGGQIGYNYQFDRRWLAGVEADFSGSGIKGQNTTPFIPAITAAFLPVTFTANASEEIKWFGTVRGRLGFLATPDLLLFGTGGFAYGQVNHAATVFNTNAGASIGFTSVVCVRNSNCYAGSSSRMATGWTAGGGVEYAFMRNWTVRAEYLYVNLGSDSVPINAIFNPGPPSNLNVSYTDAHFNLVRVGANYRF